MAFNAVPMTIQPGQPQPGGNWMQIPQVPNCPPGLEYLTQIDQIICHQIVDMLEVFTSFEANNKYVIKNKLGQQTDFLTRQMFHSGREFLLKVVDNYQRVLALDGIQQVGMITKQWSGMAREMYTDATNFGISFPMDLDVKVKGTLIGAMFLIDFMAFEQNKKDETKMNRRNH